MAVTGLEDTIRWYDDNADTYADKNAAYFDLNHIETFISRLPSNPAVLDAGCGPGRDANLLTERGARVVGVDLSSGLIEAAKRRFPAVDFRVGDLRQLSFVDTSFDGVWSNTSLLHFESIDDVKQAISEMVRVLKPDGILHIVVKAQTGDSKMAVVNDKLSEHDRFFQYFTLDEMSGLLVGAGLSIEIAKEYAEIETIPNGRPEVKLVWCVARKVPQARA